MQLDAVKGKGKAKGGKGGGTLEIVGTSRIRPNPRKAQARILAKGNRKGSQLPKASPALRRQRSQEDDQRRQRQRKASCS